MFIHVRVETEYSFDLGSDVMYVGRCSAVARGMTMATWPHLVLSYRQHRSQDHLTTQAPPLRQSRDNFGEVMIIYSNMINIACV